MSTEATAEQFVDLIQRYMALRPRLIPPQDVVRFKETMKSFKGSDYKAGDHEFVFRILMMLSKNSGALTMSELGSELDVPMSTATRIVDGLVQGGMVERVNDPNDRRVVRVGLSTNGRKLYETGMAYSKQRIMNLLKDFSPREQAQLVRLMNKLLDALLLEK
ncbi:MAG: MarR family winged helix-turn-helix transcriptional regulator [Bacteroidota bacterium]|jgi:DNA-binding MarR family transcriptional regulator